MKKHINLLVLIVLITICIIKTDVYADDIDKYETIKFEEYNQVVYTVEDGEYNFSREKKYNSEESLTINEDKHVKEKVAAMQQYKLLKPKTSSPYEIALAYEDGSYSYVDKAHTIDEAIEMVSEMEGRYANTNTIPAIVDEMGQVVYSTNSMGKIWNGTSGTSIVTNIYSDAGLKNAYTYVNQGYVHDVPIIQDNGTSAQIQIGGYKGWAGKSNGVVVVPLNQVKNPSYYLVKNGSLYHYISYDMSSEQELGYWIRIGKAPSYLESGINYYSYDGIYFYQGSSIYDGLNKLITDLKKNTNENSVNANQPNYNYYQYLSFRTRTNYTSAELNNFIEKNTKSNSKLREIGNVLIECQNNYGVNPLLILGLAANESAWGVSEIALEKNNIFGVNAIDTSPGSSSNSFSSVDECIREFCKIWISSGYANPQDYRYYGGYLGNKALGANVKYASDPYWGEKAAQHAYTIDLFLSNGNINELRDYDGYSLALYMGANRVTKKDGTVLYNINAIVKDYGGYAGNIIALKFNEAKNNLYEMLPDRTDELNSSYSNEFNGRYDWSISGYISTNNVKIVNMTTTSFIPGFDKEDVNKDFTVDIEDLATVAGKYSIGIENSLYKRYIDINCDSFIDLYDLVMCSKKMK